MKTLMKMVDLPEEEPFTAPSISRIVVSYIRHVSERKYTHNSGCSLHEDYLHQEMREAQIDA